MYYRQNLCYCSISLYYNISHGSRNGSNGYDRFSRVLEQISSRIHHKAILTFVLG